MAETALRAQPNYLTAVRAAAASHALAGRLDKARQLMAYMRGIFWKGQVTGKLLMG
jgi:hypothetical protein